jgi:hypothetical protein
MALRSECGPSHANVEGQSRKMNGEMIEWEEYRMGEWRRGGRNAGYRRMPDRWEPGR